MDKHAGEASGQAELFRYRGQFVFLFRSPGAVTRPYNNSARASPAGSHNWAQLPSPYTFRARSFFHAISVAYFFNARDDDAVAFAKTG